MNYLGDFAEDETIYTWFTTNDADGGRVAFSAALETADFEVIKDGNATGTTAGITPDEDFDSKTGIHKVTVATTDAFYVTGSDYALLMYPDETVDSQSVAHVVATWSIENRYQMQTGDSFARIGAAGAGLTAIDLPNQTMDITGSLSGSVGSVTGAVGSVTGAVGSVTAGVDLADDAIKAAKFDESTAFPLTAVNGSTLTEAGGTGDHLTDLGGMSTTMKGQVNTEADAALSDYDAPTKTEMD
ncbi:MAG: hypothetical protein GY744_00350, partial [Gammaproteobacteria bacterium]|nr:hypothetical protein [Gammaproteobacteria bacterium]